MNKYLFVFLNLILSSVTTAAMSALLGLLSSAIKSEHPHQIIPNWLILAFVGMILGAIVGLIWAIIMVYKEKALLLPKSIFIASAFSMAFMILLFLAITLA
jgi:uncharacterized membrane protein SpoIIM required for sporulation